MPDLFFEVESPVPAVAPDPSPLGVRVGSGLTRIDDHCRDARGHLITRYRGKPRMEDLLCVLGDRATDLESALWDLYTLRTLDNAVGAQLDGLGNIVGEPRKGRVDEVYRVYIRIRILVNRASGQIEDLYNIIRLVFGPDASVRIQDYYPAAATLTLLNPVGDQAPDFVTYLRQAKPVGVRFGFIHLGFVDRTNTLIWDSSVTPLGLTADQSWGSSVSGPSGGLWAGVL